MALDAYRGPSGSRFLAFGEGVLRVDQDARGCDAGGLYATTHGVFNRYGEVLWDSGGGSDWGHWHRPPAVEALASPRP